MAETLADTIRQERERPMGGYTLNAEGCGYVGDRAAEVIWARYALPMPAPMTDKQFAQMQEATQRYLDQRAADEAEEMRFRVTEAITLLRSQGYTVTPPAPEPIDPKSEALARAMREGWGG